ncbi:hypothetical protein BLOT_013910 [Blomia tropicalis]|nr:hypothetical protein BLOT_013910 [Blomia tropicalis]
MESNDTENLNSYLKTMFIKYHGDKPLKPPTSSLEITTKPVEEDIGGKEDKPESEVDVNNNNNNMKNSIESMNSVDKAIMVSVDVHHVDEMTETSEIKETPPVDGFKQAARTFVNNLQDAIQKNGHLNLEKCENEERSSTKISPEVTNQQPPTVIVSYAPDKTPEENDDVVDNHHESEINTEDSQSSVETIETNADSHNNNNNNNNQVEISKQPIEPNLKTNGLNTNSKRDNGTLYRSVSLGGFETNARVINRSISQDVKFKLSSIKEEKTITKSHVSELANIWKDKLIKPIKSKQ